jgi:hypothetical protein
MKRPLSLLALPFLITCVGLSSAKAQLMPAQGTSGGAFPAPAMAGTAGAGSSAASFDAVAALRPLGCAPTHLLQAPGTIYAVCQGSGVWATTPLGDGSVVLRERRQGAVEASTLFLRGADVWVQFVTGGVSPLLALPVVPQASVVAAPLSAQNTPLHREGKVLSANRTSAVVSLGKLDGVNVGDHVEAHISAEPDESLGMNAERIAVGRVVTVSDNRASVEFGFGEAVVTGTVARRTNRRTTAEPVAPDRIGNMFAVEGTLRPYLPIKHAGIGALGEVALTYRARTPVFLRAELMPFGGRTGSGMARGAWGAFSSGGWDHGLFSVGVGIGVLYRRDYANWDSAQNEWSVSSTGAYRKSAPSFAVMQFVRVGALDGLHVSFSNVLAIAKNSDEWTWGYLLMRGQIPLGGNMWLRPTVGGGAGGGFILAEMGLRTLVRGNGRGGSVFLTPSVGVTGIGVRSSDANAPTTSGLQGSLPGNLHVDQDYVLGPMVGLSAEYRLGL